MIKISIIIPTYNRAGYLKKAVESALNQDYQDIEVIISDNASTDETSDIIKIYSSNNKVKYFRNNENIGMVSNWRKALFERSSGDYFIILSDDDFFLDNNYITKAVNLINADNNIVIVSANSIIRYEDTGEEVKLEFPFTETVSGRYVFLSKKRDKSKGFTLSNTIFKRSLAIKLNAFSNIYNTSCDLELFWKMCLFGNIGVVNEYVSVYRMHKKNESKVIKGDIRFLVNNNMAYIEPYKFAKSIGCFKDDELKVWEKRISEKLYRTLKSAYKNHYYDDVYMMLKDMNESLLKKAVHDYYFRIMFLKLKKSLQEIKRLYSKKWDKI